MDVVLLVEVVVTMFIVGTLIVEMALPLQRSPKPRLERRLTDALWELDVLEQRAHEQVAATLERARREGRR